jgi:hypothetical protein
MTILQFVLSDYSPNRKMPLEREIRVSSSPDQIKELWEELATEGFTKGWAPISELPAVKEIAVTQKPTAAVAVSEDSEAGPASTAKKRATKKAPAVAAEVESMPPAASAAPTPRAKKRTSSNKKPD